MPLKSIITLAPNDKNWQLIENGLIILSWSVLIQPPLSQGENSGIKNQNENPT
jgi:hypothetical protein